MKTWTEFEIQLLVKHYPYYSNPDLQKLFLPNKSPCAIQHKASRLGIYKDPSVRREIIYQNVMKAKQSNYKGWTRSSSGYIFITLPNGERIQEHRLIMEQILGRPLRPDEVVHHKNGIITDNRPENLEVMTSREHTILHNTGRVHSLETRQKISQKTKERFKSKEKHPSYKAISKELLLNAYFEHMSVKKTCEILGITRRTFYNKLEEFNLKGWYSCLTNAY